MAYTVYQTTAEHVLSVADAVVLKNGTASKDFISEFTGLKDNFLDNALAMADEIGLILIDGMAYKTNNPISKHLSFCNKRTKPDILSIFLDEYPPFKFFIKKLSLEEVPSEAARQTCALMNITTDNNILLNTFISLGSYCRLIIQQGGGLLTVNKNDIAVAFEDLFKIIVENNTAHNYLQKRMGIAVYSSLDTVEIIDPLVRAVIKLNQDGVLSKDVIRDAATAVESYLTKLIDSLVTNPRTATGIIQKSQLLKSEGIIKKKHAGIIEYLGQIRNASDHGTDNEINQTWRISVKTSLAYVNVAIDIIGNLEDFIKNSNPVL